MTRGAIQESRSWIFVSHSTRDIDKVRTVRNYLEMKRARPLLFFLKCIADEPTLFDLLKKEIEARDVFLLCNSENSRNSSMVRKEIDWVKNCNPPKIYVEIDLDFSWEEQKAALDRLRKFSTVYLSYAKIDEAKIRPYIEAIKQSDLAVFRYRASSNKHISIESLEGRLLKTADRGTLLAFVSRSSWPVKQSLFAACVENPPFITRIIFIEIEPNSVDFGDRLKIVTFNRDLKACVREVLELIATANDVGLGCGT